ncbi:mRNA splicing protein [Borealophlyctis nickersoniae]|nr:mRNA splicing protein [Borealophlyctis nickersoniae]
MASAKPKSEMTEQELLEREEQEFQTGPLSVLTQVLSFASFKVGSFPNFIILYTQKSVKNNTQIIVMCRNNRKLLARVKAFDRHCNMVLENVKEMWTETPRTGKGQKAAKPINRDRFISKMFLRGDSVILVLRNIV